MKMKSQFGFNYRYHIGQLSSQGNIDSNLSRRLFVQKQQQCPHFPWCHNHQITAMVALTKNMIIPFRIQAVYARFLQFSILPFESKIRIFSKTSVIVPALTSLALNLPMPFPTKTDFRRINLADPYSHIHPYQTHPQVVINAFIRLI